MVNNVATSGLGKSQSASDSGNGLLHFFALAYLTQGISSQFGIVSQPVQFFMLRQLGLTAADMSAIFALLMIPWVVKPAYGLIVDLFPLFGLHRKSYLVASHLLALFAMVPLAFGQQPVVIIGGLFGLAIAMSIATAIMLGLAAETGARDGKTSHYFSAQSYYYYLGNVGALLAAGFLCQSFAPQFSLTIATCVAAIPVLVSTFCVVRLVHEEKRPKDSTHFKRTMLLLRNAVRSPALWLCCLFAFCWNFTPSFGVPLYVYETDHLEFSQSIIGQLGAWNALGMMVGAIIYRDLFKRLTLTQRLYVIAPLWSLSILSYVFLNSPFSALVLEVIRGVANTIAIVGVYELAATICPRNTSVSVMALLLAFRNIANELGTLSGGNLFTHVFHGSYLPLVWVGAALPFASIFVIPLAVKKIDEARVRLAAD